LGAKDQPRSAVAAPPEIQTALSNDQRQRDDGQGVQAGTLAANAATMASVRPSLPGTSRGARVGPSSAATSRQAKWFCERHGGQRTFCSAAHRHCIP
jgi:hypothetical protein